MTPQDPNTLTPNTTQPPTETQVGSADASPNLNDVVDAMLARIRALTLHIVTDRDRSVRALQETAYDLAILLQDLDTHACLGTIPRAWQRSTSTPSD